MMCFYGVQMRVCVCVLAYAIPPFRACMSVDIIVCFCAYMPVDTHKSILLYVYCIHTTMHECTFLCAFFFPCERALRTRTSVSCWHMMKQQCLCKVNDCSSQEQAIKYAWPPEDHAGLDV